MGGARWRGPGVGPVSLWGVSVNVYACHGGALANQRVWQAVGAFQVWRHYVSGCGNPPSTLLIHAETKRVYSQTRERKQSNATSRGLEAVRSPAYDDNRNRETPVQKCNQIFPVVRTTGRLRTISQRLTLVYGKFRHNPLFSIPRLTRSTPPTIWLYK